MISLSHSWQPAVFVDALSGVFRKSLDSAGRGTFNNVGWGSGRIRLNGQKSPHLLFREGVKQIRIARKLRRNIEFRSSGIVHVNTSRAVVAGWIATRANQKLVLHLRDDMSKVFPQNLFGRLLKRILFCKVVGVIANSKYTLDSFSPMPAGVKSLVIPSPVGTMPEIGFAQNPVSDRIVLGLVARLARWKGQDLLIDAVNLLQVARYDSEVWFVGSSDLEDSNYRFELEEKVNKLGLQERVKFIGHVDNVWEVLSQIDVCIQCSTTPEPMGQNVLQYLIAGKPIIASQEGGPAEWIVNGENGVLVAPRNADELSNAIAHLLESRSERVRLGLNAQKTIPVNFDQFNVDQFQLFLNSL
jgi:glycosyltransferase involved in cell wall biosynthesis